MLHLALKDQITKYLPQILLQFLKRYFCFLHCSKNTVFHFNQNGLKKLQEAKDGQ